MVHAFIFAADPELKALLRRSLTRNDVTFSFAALEEGADQAPDTGKPDVILFEVSERLPPPGTREFIRRMKKEKNLPSLALVPSSLLESTERLVDATDFLASPYDTKELILRIHRLLAVGSPAPEPPPIKAEGLVLDTTTCDVTVDGRKVELTFKEYELLKLLVGNRGRVFSRQELLDKVWGYDYYGGDRTVDVHIRRLRGKIELSDLVYIETVRNIGYRFTKEP